ncbi:IS4 family transposase [Spirosoma endbachense]|nr:IS4 family transposase [Spirosoma endbachense]
MITDLDFQHTYRQKLTDFSRNRTLSFPKIVVGLINLFNRSIAVELTKLLGHIHGSEAPFCSKQAFSKQRQKLKPEAFVALNDQLIQQFYADGAFATFHGFRLLAIDGSTLQLPESSEIVQHYGRSSNQTACVPMARCSLAHDILNQLTLHAILTPYRSDDRTMAWQHLEWFESDGQARGKLDDFPTLLLLDRGYPAIDLIAHLQRLKINFLMRISSQSSLQEVRDFAASGQSRATVTLNVTTAKRKKNIRLQTILRQLDQAPLVVELIAFDLPDGLKAYLITNLPAQQYGLDFFTEAYRKRWGIETQYAFDKTLLEIENFSSKKVEGVGQDFHASILCRNISGLLNLDAQQHWVQPQSPTLSTKPFYRVNRSVSLGLLKDELVDMLFGNQSVEVTYDRLVAQVSRHKSLSKPNRAFSRQRKRPRKPQINRRRAT